MKVFYFVLFFFISCYSSILSQEYSWFYLRANDTLIEPRFDRENNQLIYTGNDIKLKSILEKYSIYEFKKTFRKAKKENLKKTFFVICDDRTLLKDLLKNASHLFEFGELIKEEDKKIFEPNDYGLTSTIGENIALQVNLDNMDFLGLPQAWYYTTGSREVVVGISDARVDTTDLELFGKTKIFKQATLSKGHGHGVATFAAGQGNNGHGITGVCYDCSVKSTDYGHFKTFEQLLELSRANAKVINCSWVSTRYYQTAQDVINEIVSNGTVIVAAAGNQDWNKTKGKKYYYPASYENVISVSSGMHRYESVYDNIHISKNGSPYAANIRYYVGRTVGFKDRDIDNKHHIWPVSTTTLNDQVDILVPSVDLFRYSQYKLFGKMEYTIEATSSTAPFVTGTVGLMYSLNPCLPIDEVETIIKITSTNIDNVQANKPYAGHYGAGMLNTGRTIKMVYDLYTETEIATIENQNFSRWDFKLTAFSKEVIIQNQKFTDDAILNLTAKNRIVIGKNTILKPNSEGQIVLKIDPTLKKECELQLREGFPNNKYYHPQKNSFTN